MQYTICFAVLILNDLCILAEISDLVSLQFYICLVIFVTFKQTSCFCLDVHT